MILPQSQQDLLLELVRVVINDDLNGCRYLDSRSSAFGTDNMARWGLASDHVVDLARGRLGDELGSEVVPLGRRQLFRHGERDSGGYFKAVSRTILW